MGAPSNEYIDRALSQESRGLITSARHKMAEADMTSSRRSGLADDSLMKCLMAFEPQKRWDVDQAMRHEYFVDVFDHYDPDVCQVPSCEGV